MGPAYHSRCSYLEALVPLDCLPGLAIQADLECLAHLGHLSPVDGEVVLHTFTLDSSLLAVYRLLLKCYKRTTNNEHNYKEYMTKHHRL